VLNAEENLTGESKVVENYAGLMYQEQNIDYELDWTRKLTLNWISRDIDYNFFNAWAASPS
jgi:hypothetical protein